MTDTITIFTEHIFPKYKPDEVMRSHMKGIDDPTLKEFLLYV